MEEVITVRYAAEAIGISTGTLRLWISSGKYPAKKLTEGRERVKIILFKSDLEEFLGVNNAMNSSEPIKHISQPSNNDVVIEELKKMRVGLYSLISDVKRENRSVNIDDVMTLLVDTSNRVASLATKVDTLNNTVKDMVKSNVQSIKPVPPMTTSKPVQPVKSSPYNKFGGR